MQDHLERHCIVLQAFGFNSAKYDINLIESYSLPLLVIESKIETIVIKKYIQFVSFKPGDVQLIDLSNFPGGPTGLKSFLKVYKSFDTRRFSPYEGFKIPQVINKIYIPSREASFR